jgi:hypothetical protein
MTYEITVTDKKIPYIQQELGEDKVEIIEKGKDNIHRIKVTIKDQFDIMHLIHAGVRYGINIYS